jgi:hypothetical protein
MKRLFVIDASTLALPPRETRVIIANPKKRMKEVKTFSFICLTIPVYKEAIVQVRGYYYPCKAGDDTY